MIDPAPLQAALGAGRRIAGAGAGQLHQRARRRRTRAPARAAEVHLAVRPRQRARRRTQRRGRGAGGEGRASSSARINLGYATVRSPITGRAGKQQVTEGALVGQGDATLLTTVDQIDPLYVNFSMSVDRTRRRCAGAQQPAARRTAGAGVAARRHAVRARRHARFLRRHRSIRRPARSRCARASRIPTRRCCPAPTSPEGDARQAAQRLPACRRPPCSAMRTSAYVLVVGKDGKVARKDVADRSPAQGATGSSAPALRRATRSSSPACSARSPAQPAKADAVAAAGQSASAAEATPAPSRRRRQPTGSEGLSRPCPDSSSTTRSSPGSSRS